MILQFWGYTLVPPIVTTILYFAVFGEVIGKRVGQLGGVDYIQYIAPGLAMLWVINQAYSSTAGGVVGARFFKYIEEILVSPLPVWLVVTGYVVSGVIRGVAVGIIVLLIALFFTRLPVHSVFASCAVLLLTALVSALAGFTAGLFAKDFGQVYGLQTYVITPLTYVGGIFNSISALPTWAQKLTLANPMFYAVSAFRHTVLGVSDAPFETCMWVTGIGGVGLSIAAVTLMKRGTGMRS